MLKKVNVFNKNLGFHLHYQAAHVIIYSLYHAVLFSGRKDIGFPVGKGSRCATHLKGRM